MLRTAKLTAPPESVNALIDPPTFCKWGMVRRARSPPFKQTPEVFRSFAGAQCGQHPHVAGFPQDETAGFIVFGERHDGVHPDDGLHPQIMSAVVVPPKLPIQVHDQTPPGCLIHSKLLSFLEWI